MARRLVGIWRKAEASLGLPFRFASARKLGAGIALGLALGGALGLLYDLAFQYKKDSPFGIEFGGVFGVTGVVMAILIVTQGENEMQTRTSGVDAARPEALYKDDLRRNMVLGPISGALYAILFGVFAWSITLTMTGFTVSLDVGLGCGLWFGLLLGVVVLGPAPRLAAVDTFWVLGGRRAQFMATLRTASDRQVLRQAGAIYQFRHAALQDLFCAGEAEALLASPDARLGRASGARHRYS